FPETEYLRPVVMLASLAMFGFLQMSCPRIPRAIELMISALVNHRPIAMYSIKIGIFLFTALLFSRYYCSWICPKGVIQEYIFMKDLNLRVPEKLDRILKKIKYLLLFALIIATLFGDFRLFEHIGPFHVLFNMDGSVIMIVWLSFWLVLGVFVSRPFCRYFCPEGALLGLVNRISLLKMEAGKKAECTGCKRCEKVCPVDAIISEDACETIDDYECIMCRSCEKICAKECITFSYGIQSNKSESNKDGGAL
ncbi:MAG: 4Fe-4S binding protein, partial [Deltaproteobacteria bacterium]|nr:4Fe-4S binding protein [Deltaproteobacteria bacterium]